MPAQLSPVRSLCPFLLSSCHFYITSDGVGYVWAGRLEARGLPSVSHASHFGVLCAYIVIRHPKSHFDHQFLSLNLSHVQSPPLPLFLLGSFTFVLCLFPALYPLFTLLLNRLYLGASLVPSS